MSSLFYLRLSIRPLLVALLPLSGIPAQLSSDAVNPILGSSSFAHHIRKWVSAGADRNIISWSQLNSFSAVKARPAACSRIIRNSNAENYGIGKNDGPKGERMGADCCDENDRVLRVAEGASSGKIIGC